MTIADTPFVLVDTETTGTEDDAELLEIAAHCMAGEMQFSTYVMPLRPIPPQASAIHHIVDGDVVGAPGRDLALEQLERFVPADGVVVAHHAAFDRRMLAPALADRPWCCTMRLARHLLPDAPAYGNAALWYYLGGHKITDVLHGATTDLVVTRFVFEQLLRRYREFARERAAGDAERIAKSEQVETLVAFADRPYTMRTMPFGKHRGVPMDRVPQSYFRWALDGGMPDLDDDLRYNFEKQLRRNGAAA